MAQPTDPDAQSSSPGGQAQSSVEANYQQAIAAFKAQRYDQALTYFQRLGQQPPGSPYFLKALMGRVRVHQQLGQTDAARLLCNQLVQGPSASASQWAKQVLRQLPPSAEGELGGDAQVESLSTGADSGHDLSGFMPLEQPNSQTKGATVNPDWPERGGHRPGESTPPAWAESLASEKPATAGERSLFHYQQLNQRPGEANQSQEPAPRIAGPPPQDSRGAAPSASPQTDLQSPHAQPRPRPQAPLPRRPLELWAGQGLTAIALGWAISWGLQFALKTLDRLLQWVRWPVAISLPGAHQPYTLWVMGGLLLLGLASPWLMDYCLALGFRQRSLSTRQLQGSSPGALRLLRQVCRQQGWQLPELRVIADPTPLCFSYGWQPRNTRIVVSQGLLDRLSDQEITALYGYELAGMVNHSLPVLSGLGFLLLLLYGGYRWLAKTGDTITQPLLQTILGLLASIVYGLFWLLRQIGLWLSRLRCGWGDRRAVALTQHPDHLIEGLLGFTRAIATHLQQREQRHPLQASLEILMPVGFRQALGPGNLLASSQENEAVQAMLMATDGLNPYRQWLRVNASHLPLGERLLWLHQQALVQNQPNIAPEQPSHSAQVSLPLLLLQKGPLAGLLAGGSLAMGLWFLGGIVNRLGWQRLNWLYQDPSILAGGLWLGLGLGLLLRINLLFPDAVSATAPGSPGSAEPNTVVSLLQVSNSLPVQGQPVTLRGELRGQPGIGNWGSQDLYLADPSGLVRLTNPVPLGSLQGIFQPRNHPFRWIGRRVLVTGWGRYSNGILWVDINQIRLGQQQVFQTYGPIWATLISLGASLFGIVTILRGG